MIQEEKQGHHTNENFILDVEHVSKTFGGIRALDNVDFRVRRGEVHALLGENGAGKSTLMKIIMGINRIETGQIYFDGEEIGGSSTSEVLKKGLSMIHQELNVEPHLTVAENIFLMREDRYKGTPILNKKKTVQKARILLDSFESNINPKSIMGSLTVAQMQMIEIVKAVSYDAKLIIMDEPTSSLDNNETQRLFKTICDLKNKGVSVIYISHRLEEIYEVCDRVSVFRDGKYIATENVEAVTKDDLIALMVGRRIDNLFPKEVVEITDEVFRIKNFSGVGFTDINFTVHKGEILGVCGLVGSGRSETMRAIFGLDKKQSGTIYFEGNELDIQSPRQAIRNGIAMVNEDRKGYGLILKRSVRENVALPNLFMFEKFWMLNRFAESRAVNDVRQKLNLKTSSLESTAYSLSGGNQQKVVLSKWILSNPKVLILDEPTRGIDVGAKSEIHRMMSSFAGQGMAIILISSELPEVLAMSDRILVYAEGKINGEVSRADVLSKAVTEEDILSMAFGQKVDTK